MGSRVHAQHAEAAGDRLVLEKLFSVVKNEGRLEFQLGDPARRRLVVVEMNFAWSGRAEIVREPSQLQCSPAADYSSTYRTVSREVSFVLPEQTIFFIGRRQLNGRAAVHAPRYLVQPAVRAVLTPQGARIALTLKPSSVDDQAFLEVMP